MTKHYEELPSDGGTADGCDRDADPAHDRGKVVGAGRLGKSRRGARPNRVPPISV
ncbi:hypothetical protein [Streptomyces sp. NPDC004728]|uniref:hypothetical protein n=1 Tax=Streptomyces sp. NPDC004728 TaxID=3154289 RepID=UPI0033A753E3